MSNLNLKGIWIPIEILTDNRLSDKEKTIYSIILYLSKENNYCYLSNKSISELYFSLDKYTRLSRFIVLALKTAKSLYYYRSKI